MSFTLFKFLYCLEFLVISIVRTTHTAKFRTLQVAKDRKSILDMVLLAAVGIAMLVPLVYVFTSLLDFADYRIPNWVGWIGAVLFATAIWMLWRSHAELGRYWTPTLGLRQDHHLITDGIFKYVRHPMYAAHLLWAIATPMMLHNWIAGFSFLAAAAAQYLSRVGAEEQMMLEQFGEEYARYMRRTGRILPRFTQPASDGP